MHAPLVGKATSTVVTGVVGVLVVDGVKRWHGSVLSRANLVTATAWGLRGARSVEAGAELARLAAADVLAEARERVGEPPRPAPTSPAGGHSH